MTEPAFRRTAWPTAILCLALLLAMAASLTLGRYPVSVAEVLRIVLRTSPFHAIHDGSDARWVVVELVRLPRILEVVLCGMGLGLAGAAMQGVFRNPLVSPDICGVSSAASFGGVLGLLLGWSGWGVVGCAFALGLLALAVAFALARAGGGGTLALVLAGVIIGLFFGAAVGLVQYLADPQNKLPQITYWLLGSFVGASYAKVAIVAAATLVAGGVLLGLRWRINLLSLGEADAAGLGVPVRWLRWALIVPVAVLVAAQVAVSGTVAFVGLVVPHIARLLVGPEHGRLLPASAFLGGLYLLIMDDLARSLAPTEIPIGLVTSFVGAPVFAVLFWRLHGRRPGGD